MDDQLTNRKDKITPTQTIVKSKDKKKKCSECNKGRVIVDEDNQICRTCYKMKKKFKPSGNKVIDDFIKYTQINLVKIRGKMEFVPYEQFENVEFIAEGGFSKIYKATWIDGPSSWYSGRRSHKRYPNKEVVLKKLNNSKNITTKELNELKIFYNCRTKLNHSYDYHVSEYFGITQDPDTQDIMIVMPYYNNGDLIHYISNDFYNIEWSTKIKKLSGIVDGLINIHTVDIIHRDLHSGNIFFGASNWRDVCIGDLGLSKSATESADDNNENYGIIPYMAPEIFLGQKYTKASDIYSFGMIMWEFMTARRPFWDRNHDTDLIIDICDGLRPPIVTNAPDGYIDLMNECWHSDPNKRPTATAILDKINSMWDKEYVCSTCNYPGTSNPCFRCQNPTKFTEIIESPDIGPVKINNPGAIYKSRPLSGMINSVMSIRSSTSRSIINLETVKRKFENDLIEDNRDNGQGIKRTKLLLDNGNRDYLTKEIELDIDVNHNDNDCNIYTKFRPK